MKELVARRMADGIDLRQLRYLPDSMTMPFMRNGLDPPPELARRRREAPVTRLTELFGRGIWLVSGYDEARAALADGTSYSHDLRQYLSMDGRSDSEQIGGLGLTDPPDHTVLRRYLTPEFTRHRVARLEPVIRDIVEARLDAMEAAGPVVDLVEQFAFPIPFEVICELLGLPVDDREEFRELGVARFDLSQGGVGIFGSAAHTRDYLINAVAAQRAEPGDGLIGSLLREHGDELDDVTLGGLADGVFLGGYETSASMLALGTCLLAGHPEAMAMLGTDDTAASRVVEEMLRHLSVVQVAFLRIARHDLELGGQHIKAGDALAISLLGANRDERLSPGADRFDPTRPPTRHLAFGYGMHRCLGAELARLELLIALRGLVKRFPRLELAAAPDQLSFREVSAVYGIDSLPVHLDGAPTGSGG